MGCSDFVCKEKGLDPSTMHRLQAIEQGYDQESVPIAED